MGLPKAASTFIQKQIFAHIDDYDVLSDPKKYKNLRSLTKKIFYSLSRNDQIDITLVNSFAEEMTRQIKRSKKTKFIFSCEAILNFYRFNGEQNILYLSKIINVLGKNNQIQIKPVIVIRKQKDLIHSVYAYSHDVFRTEFKNISEFIEKPFENKFKKFFEYLDYGKLFVFLENSLNLSPHVLFFEELSMYPKRFISEFEMILETVINKDILIIDKVNSISDGNAKKIYSPTYYFLLKIHNYFSKNDIYNMLISKRVRNILKSLLFLKRKNNITLNQSLINKINEIYTAKNQDLAISKPLRDKMYRLEYFKL